MSEDDDYAPQRGSRLGWRIGGSAKVSQMPAKGAPQLLRGDAMDRLIYAVQEGTASTMRFEDTLGHISSALDGSADQWAELAYHGSLDAALRLQSMLLPDWPMDARFLPVFNGEMLCGITGPHTTPASDYLFTAKYEGRAKTSARAWLVAILRAVMTEK